MRYDAAAGCSVTGDRAGGFICFLPPPPTSSATLFMFLTPFNIWDLINREFKSLRHVSNPQFFELSRQGAASAPLEMPSLRPVPCGSRSGTPSPSPIFGCDKLAKNPRQGLNAPVMVQSSCGSPSAAALLARDGAPLSHHGNISSLSAPRWHELIVHNHVAQLGQELRTEQNWGSPSKGPPGNPLLPVSILSHPLARGSLRGSSIQHGQRRLRVLDVSPNTSTFCSLPKSSSFPGIREKCHL